MGTSQTSFTLQYDKHLGHSELVNSVIDMVRNSE